MNMSDFVFVGKDFTFQPYQLRYNVSFSLDFNLNSNKFLREIPDFSCGIIDFLTSGETKIVFSCGDL